ncbi:hypothetical protein [uncultured Succinivibrio sp.]|uniref:lipopolysaccharide biosynthesis protein n=1 Tax=uncultured Succinivibrio sp. TaxID=540749 RepID=UPI0025EF2E02|nr:hypothetical protein [uncultured Succinivibrio sp.]
MILERTKNSFRNIIWGYVHKIISLVLPFIIRTILIYNLGADFLGLNSLFTSIIVVFSLAELGFSSAIIYNMYKPVAENDTETICALLSFYKSTYRYIGIVILIIGLLTLPFLPHLIKTDCPTNINIYLIYFLFLFNSVISYFLFSYKNCLFSVYQREDIISKVDIITKSLLFLLQLLFLTALKNYYLFVAAMIISTITANLITGYLSSQFFPNYSCKGKINNKTKNVIKRNVIGLSIGKLCLISRNTFDNIFVSFFLGLNVVAIYSNYFYVMNAVCSLLLVLMSSITAGIGNSMVVNTQKKNYEDFRKITFMYSWISSWSVVCLFCLYQPFMTLWVGKDMLLPMVDVALFCVYFYSLTIGDVRSRYSSAAGLFWESKNYIVAESLLNIVLNYILGKYFGITGIIIASWISLLIINIGYGSKIIFKYYFKNYSIRKFFGSHFLYSVITTFTTAVTYYLTSYFSGFIGKALICIFFPNIIFFIFYSNNSDFRESICFIKKHIKAHKK